MALETDSVIVGAATSFALAVIGAAAALPRIMSGIKRDGLDSNFAVAQQKMLADMQTLFDQQIGSLKKSNEELQAQVQEMHGLIDKYRIQLTKTKSLLVEFESLLEKSGVVVPPDTKVKFAKLVEDAEETEPK